MGDGGPPLAAALSSLIVARKQADLQWEDPRQIQKYLCSVFCQASSSNSFSHSFRFSCMCHRVKSKFSRWNETHWDELVQQILNFFFPHYFMNKALGIFFPSLELGWGPGWGCPLISTSFITSACSQRANQILQIQLNRTSLFKKVYRREQITSALFEIKLTYQFVIGSFQQRCKTNCNKGTNQPDHIYVNTCNRNIWLLTQVKSWLCCHIQKYLMSGFKFRTRLLNSVNETVRNT